MHRNHVLRAMARPDMQALAPKMQDIALTAGDVLYEPGYPVEWIYFPTTAVLSVVTVMTDGRMVESDTVGCESVVGVLSALGASPSVSRTVTQIGGGAVKLSTTQLRRHADASSGLRRLLIRHALANLAQAHQSVACNALHGLSQRLCRWLLMSQDRTDDAEVRLTQQYLAAMLGVQRTTVTEALRTLTTAKLIRRGRGRIRILDRTRMIAQACECYGAVRANLQQLIGADPTGDLLEPPVAP